MNQEYFLFELKFIFFEDWLLGNNIIFEFGRAADSPFPLN